MSKLVKLTLGFIQLAGRMLAANPPVTLARWVSLLAKACLGLLKVFENAILQPMQIAYLTFKMHMEIKTYLLS